MRVLYIEPFHGGSHGAFGRALMEGVDAEWTALTLPARHWKWRMRGAAAWAALTHGDTLSQPHDLIFASSYVPLAELVGLAPALASVPAILYFHENQLAFPVRPGSEQSRDHHFGFTQLVSALAADQLVFNSAYNRDSFIEAGRALLARMPDARPPGWMDTIASRSEVLGVPLSLDPVDPAGLAEADADRSLGPVILWNHRWEHDKRPDRFFSALRAVADQGLPFRVVVAGQRFQTAPPVFEEARGWLGDRVLHWGYVEDRAAYRALLMRSHLAVSTADHEFFGVSMLEATHHGARPLVPDRLAYPELYPPPYRYSDPEGVAAAIAPLIRAWCEGQPLRADRREITAPFGPALLARYGALLERIVGSRGSRR